MPGWVNFPCSGVRHPFWQQWLETIDTSIAIRIRSISSHHRLALPVFIAEAHRSRLHGTVFSDRLVPGVPVFRATLPELQRAARETAFSNHAHHAFWKHLANAFADRLLECHDRGGHQSAIPPPPSKRFQPDALAPEAVFPFVHALTGRLGLLTATEMTALVNRVEEALARLQPVDDKPLPGGLHQGNFGWDHGRNWDAGLRMMGRVVRHLSPHLSGCTGTPPAELLQLPFWEKLSPVPRLPEGNYPLFLAVLRLPPEPAGRAHSTPPPSPRPGVPSPAPGR